MASSYRPSIEMGRNLQGRVQLSTLSKVVGGGDSGGGGSRLLSFVACMFIVSLTSGNYAFSFFSGALKCTLDLTQAQLDSIGVYPTLAGLFTWTTGIVNDRYGPRVAVVGGCLGQALTLFAYWIVSTDRVHLPSTDWRLAVLVAINLVMTLFNGAITAGVFCSITANFPDYKGLAVGIAKAWVGLSSGILTVVYIGLRGKPDKSRKTLDFVLLMGGFALIAGLLPGACVKIVKYRGFAEPGLRQKFAFCFAVVFSMAALVTSAAIADDHLSQDHRRYFSIAILVLLSSLLLVPLPWPSECVGSDGGKHEEVVPLLAGSVAKTVATTGGLAPLPELSSLEMLRTRECWLLFWGVGWISGGGWIVNVNMNQMCESLGPRADVSVGLALFSVGNGLGRIIGGSISEWVHQKQLEPRTMSLFVASLVMMLAHVIFALNFGVEGLYVGITMCGAAFGSTWPLTVVITAELWGSKHHGSNYMLFDGCTSAFASYVLAKKITQAVYEAHIKDNLTPGIGNAASIGNSSADGHGCDSKDDDAHKCLGVDCFHATHLAEVVLAASGCLSLLVLSARVRPLYRLRWAHEDAIKKQG